MVAADAGFITTFLAYPCACAAAVPLEPPRGALGATCEHGNRWRLLTFYRWPDLYSWCGPALDGCTVEVTAEELVAFNGARDGCGSGDAP